MKNLWKNPYLKSLSIFLGIVGILLSILQSFRDNSDVQIENSVLNSSPVVIGSPGTNISIFENDNKIELISLAVVLEGIKRPGADTPPFEAPFIGVDGNDAFLESENGQKIYLDFQSPVIFKEESGRISVENNFTLRSGSSIQFQALDEIKKYKKLIVPIITIVYGGSIETIKKLKVTMLINGDPIFNKTWDYNSPFKPGATFTIPLEY